MKKVLIEFLEERKSYEIVDHGCPDTKRVDYPDFAHKVAIEVAKDLTSLGLLICGTGIGIGIAANKTNVIINYFYHFKRESGQWFVPIF